MVGSAILNSRIVEGHKFYANKNFIEKVRKTIYKQVHYQRSGSRKFRLHFNFLCSTVVVNGEQKIIHEQEVPEFKREYLLNFPEPIAAKVYVIDDGDHCTMLLAEEY